MTLERERKALISQRKSIESERVELVLLVYTTVWHHIQFYTPHLYIYIYKLEVLGALSNRMSFEGRMI